MQLIYIDILRKICPNDETTEFEFILFGSFDAMKVYQKNGNEPFTDINQLWEKNRDCHAEVVSPYFDRQPLYLYSNKSDILDLRNLIADS